MSQATGMPARAPCDLSEVVLFRDLAADELARVGAVCRRRTFDVGQFVLHHYEESSDLFFVLEGAVRVVIYSMAGRDVVFRDLRRGDIFGELAAIDGGLRSANIMALSRTTLAVMSREAFHDATRTYPVVMDALLGHLVGLIRRYSQRVVELSTLGVEDRIRVELLRLALEHHVDENRVALSPAPTLADLAGRIGTTREAVSREIARLSRKGLVERRRDALVVLDVHRLHELVAPAAG